MAILIGAVLAFSVGLLMTFIGLDRDRAFYPTVMIVIASYYALFAVMGASTQALMIESIAIVAFTCAAIAGFKRSLWIVVVALAAHGMFDLVHGHFPVCPSGGRVSVWPTMSSPLPISLGSCCVRKCMRL